MDWKREHLVADDRYVFTAKHASGEYRVIETPRGDKWVVQRRTKADTLTWERLGTTHNAEQGRHAAEAFAQGWEDDLKAQADQAMKQRQIDNPSYGSW